MTAAAEMSSFAIRQQRTDCDRKPFFIASAADEDDDYDDEPGKSYAGRMSISLCGEKIFGDPPEANETATTTDDTTHLKCMHQADRESCVNKASGEIRRLMWRR